MQEVSTRQYGGEKRKDAHELDRSIHREDPGHVIQRLTKPIFLGRSHCYATSQPDKV